MIEVRGINPDSLETIFVELEVKNSTDDKEEINNGNKRRYRL